MKRGFSVVELVAVLLLLGILSATALSRFVRPSAFAPETVSNAVSGQGRFASQSGHARRGETITFTLAKVGTQWFVDVLADGTSIRRSEIAAHNTSILVSNGGAPVELDAAASLRLTFGRMGELVQGLLDTAPVDASLGIEVAVAGDSNRQICFYPTGYVSNVACR